MRRADDAGIDGDLLAPANPLDRALLQEAQQLGLQGHRQIADFVKHQRAPIGGLDLAEGGLACTGECAAFIAEQLAFQQVFGDGRTVDRDEAAPASGSLMQSLRQHLLAGAALAQQQDGQIARCHFVNRPADPLHCSVPSQQAADCISLLQALQTTIFKLQFIEP